MNLYKRKYTKSDRLSDVIRLISVLSIDNDAFRSENGLNSSLRSSPISPGADKWKNIIKEHPEFFRENRNGEYYALTIRSFFPGQNKTDDSNKQQRPPLTVPETQKLIDVAISLHDKEVERIQNKTRWFIPLFVALISLGGIVFSTITTSHANTDTNKKIDSLNSTIQQLGLKLKKS